MLTYVSRFWSGGFEPLWLHVILLSLSVLASLAVGAGIIFERPKYSVAIHRIAFWLVVGGVVIEAACTIFLFVFDKELSTSQQFKIIALEERIAQRSLSPTVQDRIASALTKFKGTPYDMSLTPDAELDFALQIMHTLDKAEWDHRAYGGFTMSSDELRVRDGEPHAGIIAAVFGVVVLYDSRNESLRNPAEALAAALMTEGGITAKSKAMAGLASQKSQLRTDTIHVEIGNRM